MKKIKQLQCRYSGIKSNRFWKIINSSKKNKDELYSLGCVLQNVEDFVLRRIEEANPGSVKPDQYY